MAASPAGRGGAPPAAVSALRPAPARSCPLPPAPRPPLSPQPPLGRLTRAPPPRPGRARGPHWLGRWQGRARAEAGAEPAAPGCRRQPRCRGAQCGRRPGRHLWCGQPAPARSTAPPAAGPGPNRQLRSLVLVLRCWRRRRGAELEWHCPHQRWPADASASLPLGNC